MPVETEVSTAPFALGQSNSTPVCCGLHLFMKIFFNVLFVAHCWLDFYANQAVVAQHVHRHAIDVTYLPQTVKSPLVYPTLTSVHHIR